MGKAEIVKHLEVQAQAARNIVFNNWQYMSLMSDKDKKALAYHRNLINLFSRRLRDC